jgi:hypothetical protein
MVKDYYFSGGFKATMKSGFESVFARTSRSRKPIEAQKITLDSEKVRECHRRIIPAANQILMEKMTRLVNWELEQACR